MLWLDNVDPETRSFLFNFIPFWGVMLGCCSCVDVQIPRPRDSECICSIAHGDFNTSLTRLWYVLFCEAGHDLSRKFPSTNKHDSKLNWSCSKFELSFFHTTEKTRTFEVFPLKGRANISKEQRWPDANWLRSCQPQWTLLGYRESHL